MRDVAVENFIRFMRALVWVASQGEHRTQSRILENWQAALVAGAQLLISNDTVAAHLATQAGTPCLVLMGENYGKFFPYPPPALLQAPFVCLFPPS